LTPEEKAGDEGDAVEDRFHVAPDEREEAVALRHLFHDLLAFRHLQSLVLILIFRFKMCQKCRAVLTG